MNVIQPYIYLDKNELSISKLRAIERAARICYKSEGKISEESYYDFLNQILQRGHESVIEHEKATVYFVTDRGVTHEIVRHRISSYSQESTRYCNYISEKFGNEITVIAPYYYNSGSEQYKIWEECCLSCEKAYVRLISSSKPQEARAVLPNSLKTEIAVTYNFREWRHFFKLRCSKQAHPQMQQIAIPLLRYFQREMPCLFQDIEYNVDFPEQYYASVQVRDLI